MFDILRKEGCSHVAPDDLKSMMAGILLSHPGLEFLQETPEFQDRYMTYICIHAAWDISKMFLMGMPMVRARHSGAECGVLFCRYAETVIHRIFYKQDKSGSGRLSFRDLKRYD